jgi:hypothetical protein
VPLHASAPQPLDPEPKTLHPQRPRSWWPAAIMASSARRVLIGYLVLVKAAGAGGDQKPPSWQSLTATPMTGNSEAPLEHLASPTVCEGLDVEQSLLHVLEPTFPANGAEVGGVRERAASPGVPNPPPGPPRRLAAQGGKGELCTALNNG